jgi:hypothetical protein
MTATIVELGEQVVVAVNAARAAKTDENVIAELEAVLKELHDLDDKFGPLMDVISEIPSATRSNAELDHRRTALTPLQEAAATDAIGAARSEEGRAMIRELRNGVTELDQKTSEAWDGLRQSLRAEVGTDFLRKLNTLPGFGIAQTLLADNYVVLEVTASGRLPDADRLRAAKDARSRVDEGLRQLQALLPPDVRRPLEKCFRGELFLTDVNAELLDWIHEKGLESAFTVEAS